MHFWSASCYFIVARYLESPLNRYTLGLTAHTVVRSWLRGDPSRFKPFLGNRVAEIMDGLPSNHTWHHIPGSSNPANCASRGLYPVEPANRVMWWESLSWLRLSAQDWPPSLELVDCPRPDEEKPSPPETTLVAISELSLLTKYLATAVGNESWRGYCPLPQILASVQNSG